MYFGSVRFFKNIIFAAVCLLILIPTLFAVKFYRQARAASPPSPPPVLADDAASHGSPDTLFEPDAVVEPQEIVSSDGTRFSADQPAYQALYESDFYAPQPYAATERVEYTAYLTFDDGPSDRTDEILSILAEKGVKATFFVNGRTEAKDLERMRRIVEEGHTIGMHSYSHDYSAVYASIESFLDEFYRNFKQIQEATGTTPTVFRFPGGSINAYDAGIYQELISEMIRRGFVPFDWNVSSEDATTTRVVPTAQLVENVMRNTDGKVRCFILFHDSEQKVTTPAAIGEVIDRLREKGFTFAAITPNTLPVLYHYTE